MPQRQQPVQTEGSVDLAAVAIKAMDVLAMDLRRPPMCIKDDQPNAAFVDILYAAIQSPDPDAALKVVKQLRNLGVCDPDVSDRYIPEIARRYGQAWLDDTQDFATVSIAGARLQGLLRAMGPNWQNPSQCLPTDQPACMLVVPECAQHTLGASICAGQLRRNGVAVQLEIGKSPTEICSELKRGAFHALLISVSTLLDLACVREIVHEARMNTLGIPVVIGGCVLNQNHDIKAHTGCDYVTASLNDALRICRLAAERCHKAEQGITAQIMRPEAFAGHPT